MSNDETYLFYNVMNYPLPQRAELFAYSKELPVGDLSERPSSSRAKAGPHLEEFLERVKKYSWLYRSLPFVDCIYLANSITFNALHEGSDIDLFFVVKDDRLWIARLWSALAFFVLGLKRFGRWTHKKFCLSFYVTESSMHLLPLKLIPHDPYLIYWIAHLVPLYDETGNHAQRIYEENDRVEDYLVNFPGKQSIFLDLPVVSGTSRIKRKVEFALSGKIGDLLEQLIKLCRLPILFWKRRRLGRRGEEIIISDRMLKFHADKRRTYATKRKVAKSN